MFTDYFSKNNNPTTPSPDSRPTPQSTHQHQEYLNSALKEFRLGQQGTEDRKNTATTINAAVNQIRERKRLLADGSNFCKWNHRIQELVNQFIYDAEFFTKRCVHIHSEQVSQAIILNSVDPSLEDELSGFNTCYELFYDLSTRFASVCCSA
ncbi:hypothetical protein PCASD_17862 [Puccinia coronata f. sp. avenae]|uniref:Uncharacterized protein n=1 Tax=Puccinia coronata f. sp. avenae TaxID=200324 RepID=A0A2N5TQD6_9BASI|nr:hypothetical protein PCASD_17862 [Puccinia coronata f. sp. avenae]